MTNQAITAFALATPNGGETNQILGAFKALSDLTGDIYNFENSFLLPENVNNYKEIREKLKFSDFSSYASFKKEAFKQIDSYIRKAEIIPQIFITAYSQGENTLAGSNVDAICRAVKEYYAEHNLGNILTAVLTGKLNKYQYVDLVNIPKHLMTLNGRIRILQHKSIKKRVLITKGTINNFSRQNVKNKNKELLQLISKQKDNPDLAPQISKLSSFINASKRIVFCLGGRVEGNEIIFDVNYANKLFKDAQKLAQKGYHIVFVNGPRTPNEVTDFLYEQSLTSTNITFQNCKQIAQNDEDRIPQRWRIYSGKYEEEFKILAQIGNIYPAVLGFHNTLVVHTLDSYSSCETANAAIPTAISSKGIYVDPNIRYDCHNLQKLLCPKYAIDWDDFFTMAVNMNIEPKDLNPQVLSSPLRVFAETCLNRILKVQARTKKTTINN